MASRKRIDAPRNDAEAVFDRLFGDTEGWDERVAAATDAVMLAEEIYALRERHSLSQLALAKLINSSQSAIARMEDATYQGHSISVLRKIAAAVGEKVIVRFVAPETLGRVKRKHAQTRKAESTNALGNAATRTAAEKAGALSGAGTIKRKRVRA